MEPTWTLIGEAYGRHYDERLTFVERKSVAIPEDIVKHHLEVHPDLSERHLENISHAEQAVFRNDKGIEIVVQPRHEYSALGDDEDGRGNTICGLDYDGEYVALALYNEKEKTILAHEY